MQKKNNKHLVTWPDLQSIWSCVCIDSFIKDSQVLPSHNNFLLYILDVFLAFKKLQNLMYVTHVNC